MTVWSLRAYELALPERVPSPSSASFEREHRVDQSSAAALEPPCEQVTLTLTLSRPASR